MSDDIDIEEHDLFDNPMLKNIFPDLSVLKEEIDEDLNQATTETNDSKFSPTKNNPNVDLKQIYDYQNKQSVTPLVKRDVLKPIPSSILDNKQIICGNKIILGSKPPKIQQKRNFQKQAKLTISNIGPYLEKSNKYCKECLILYPNKLKLEAHMKSTHLEKVGRNSYIKIKKKSKLKRLLNCDICHTFFNSRGDLERHYITKHETDMSTYLNKNVEDRGTNMPLSEKPKTNSKHSCSHCHKLFPNVSDLIAHMYEIFKLKKNKIKCKKGLGKNLQSFRQPVLDQQKTEAYQCPFCSYYFITAKNYYYHIRKKHNMSHITDVNRVVVKLHCKDCDLDFINIKAYNNHIIKSHLEPEDLEIGNKKDILNLESEKESSGAILTLTPEVQVEKSYAFKSVLFKCSLCDVHFLSANIAIKHLHHLEILIHWKCNICQKIFKKNDEFYHKTQHTYSDEFNVFNLDSTTELKVLFKCLQCAVHFTEEKYLLHSPLCGTTEFISVYCTVCDILIEKAIMENHKYSHDYKKYQKDDYIVIDTECIIAKNKCENVLSATSTIPNKDLQSSSKNVMAKESECTMPNILFLCKNCNYAVDNYDKTIDHCQEHCQSNNDITSLECNICSYRFSVNDYTKHQKLHEKNQWNATLLKVFSYDNAYFLSENAVWTRHLFGLLSNSEMVKEFTQASIYRYEHRIKLHILQDGPIELTVYKCEKCCRFIDPISLFKHSDSCTFHLRRHPCPICGLPFISITAQKNHKIIHENTDVGIKSYKIVSFNNTEDTIFNKNIIDSYNQHLLFQCRMCSVAINKGEVEEHKVKCSKGDIKKCDVCGLLIYQSYYESHMSKHRDIKSFNENNIKIILFGKKSDKSCKLLREPSFRGVIIDYTFYKCSKCAVCVSDVQSTLEHSCSFNVAHAKCPKCPIHLYTNNLHEHIKMHEREIEFKQDYIYIIKFNVGKQCDEIFNRDSKLKMSPVVVINREKIPILYKKHLVKSNSTQGEKFSHVNRENGDGIRNIESNKRGDIIEKEIDIFKCFCGLHFLDENSANKHADNCNTKSKICKQTCSKCNLLFTPNELFTHVLDHHGNKFITYRYNVIEIFEKDDIP